MNDVKKYSPKLVGGADDCVLNFKKVIPFIYLKAPANGGCMGLHSILNYIPRKNTLNNENNLHKISETYSIPKIYLKQCTIISEFIIDVFRNFFITLAPHVAKWLIIISV